MAAGLSELIFDPIGSLFDGSFRRGAYGGHRDHVHAASANPYVMLALLQRALKLGLHISENPLFDRVDPVHVKNSWHYRTFPGTFSLAGHKGRLGEAADISGNAEAMARLFKFARRRYAASGPTGQTAAAPARAPVVRPTVPPALLAALLQAQRPAAPSPAQQLAGLTAQNMGTGSFSQASSPLVADNQRLDEELKAIRRRLLSA